jgi:uncharacterized membrane protein
MKKTFTTLLTLLFVYTAFSQGLSETEEKNFHLFLDILFGVITGTVLMYVASFFIDLFGLADKLLVPKGSMIKLWLIFVGISTLIFIL